MDNLRRWALDSSHPYALQIAADARLSQTDYVNDHIWEVVPGSGDAPALALQTRYGGRVGLASLVPMWWHEGQPIYQADAYAQAPVVTAFAPGYVRLEARLTDSLALTVDCWAMESHAVGCRYTVRNNGDQPATLRLDIVGQVAAARREQPLAILTLADDTYALALGRLPDLEPVIFMAGAQAEIVPGQRARPKIIIELDVAPGETSAVRWVHAGLDRKANSLRLAHFWHDQDWDAALRAVEGAAKAIPEVYTGSDDHDAVIAFACQHLVQSLLNPVDDGGLPYTSFVASRQPDKGYSARGDGSDYDRAWSGQSPHVAYLVAPGLATIAPELAQGLILNYLASQTEDGAIDFKPGPTGQRSGMLCPPLLARLAWRVYQQTEDVAFLKAVYDGLLNFFNRWDEADLDADGDVLPEWQDERQTGYVFWPTFGSGQFWAQNADIRQVETPDLAAYLISEVASLRDIASELEDPGAYELQHRVAGLAQVLDHLWYEPPGRYAYRDYESHDTSGALSLLKDARADEEHLLALPLDPPARLLVRIAGGASKAPRARMLLEGQDANGQPLAESVDFEQFVWSYGGGLYATRGIFAQVDRLRFEGLSRVFKVSLHTLDLTRLDINGLLPLCCGALPAERASALIDLLTDEAHFWRANGVSLVSAQDANYDPASANGGGGVWSYWTALIGEGLLDAGRGDLAAELLRRLLDVQATVLRARHNFTEFYDSDRPEGRGEVGYLGGIPPLSLLLRVLGAWIINPRRVWTGGPFDWPTPVTIRQHGVTVSRSAAGTTITFPSGHEIVLGPDEPWQAVDDAQVEVSELLETVEPLPTPPAEIASADDESAVSGVIIEAEEATDDSPPDSG